MAPRTGKRLPAHFAFGERDVPWLLESQARAFADKRFLVWEPFEGERAAWTYLEFWQDVQGCAAALRREGVEEGDLLAIHLENCPEFLIAWFACAVIGAIAVTTNTASAGEELTYFLSHSGAKYAVTQPKFVPLVKSSGPRLRWIACTATDGGKPPDVTPTHVIPFERLRGPPESVPCRARRPFLPNHVQYTSGTTSRPKGVVWTHANALWAAKVTAGHAQLTSGDCVPVFFPLFHANALAYTVLPTLWSGGTAVLTPKYSASRFWEISLRHGCTWANMVQFTIRALETQPDPPRHTYRFWALLAQLPLVKERWGIGSISWYGMTETVSQNIVSFPGFDTPAGCIGQPAIEYEVAIRTSEGSDSAPGTIGALWVRGTPGVSLFLEYLNDTQATDAAFDTDGWFNTGDRVTWEPGGFIRFVNRANDMLRVGEENVAASEVEMVINRVPGVVESAVVGKPDDMLGEVPVAFVVVRDGVSLSDVQGAVHAACEESLSRFKQPREVIVVEQLPKGLLDKTLKRELREVAKRQ